MTTTTPTKRALFAPSPDQSLPLDLEGLPKIVERLNRDVHRAFEERQAARLAASEAKLPRRNRADAEPHPDAVARQSEALAADKAAEAKLQRTIGLLYDALADNLDAYRDSRRELAEQATEPLRSLATETLRTIAEAEMAVGLSQLADEWHNNPASAALTPSLRGHERLQRSYEKALTAQRKRGRTYGTITNEVPELLAALTLKLEADYGVTAEGDE